MRLFRKSALVSFVALISMSFLSTSCPEDEEPLATKCIRLANEAAQSATTLSTEPTIANCEAYVEAMQNYIDGCSGYLGYDDSMEALLENYDCDLYNVNQ